LGEEVVRINEGKDGPKTLKKLRKQRNENVVIQIVLTKINKKITVEPSF
jgi:hypothetical protein